MLFHGPATPGGFRPNAIRPLFSLLLAVGIGACDDGVGPGG
jgi:hypothetical protein